MGAVFELIGGLAAAALLIAGCYWLFTNITIKDNSKK